MKATKTKYKKQQKFASTRKKRSFLQKFILSTKSIFIIAVVSLFTAIYLNIDYICKDLYQMTARMGFSLKTISVEGQKYSTNEQIGKKLQLKKAVPIFSISLSDLKDRLEQLPWVKHVTVKRELPSSILISIVERSPIALGQKDRKLYIIDDEGVIINEKDLASHLSLPIIIGEGAEIYANSLIKILKTDEELFKRISSIVRVSERRWNIILDNDLEIKLPEENMEKAWKKIIKLNKSKELFLPDISSIDLRVANKIYVEKK